MHFCETQIDAVYWAHERPSRLFSDRTYCTYTPTYLCTSRKKTHWSGNSDWRRKSHLATLREIEASLCYYSNINRYNNMNSRVLTISRMPHQTCANIPKRIRLWWKRAAISAHVRCACNGMQWQFHDNVIANYCICRASLIYVPRMLQRQDSQLGQAFRQLRSRFPTNIASD